MIVADPRRNLDVVRKKEMILAAIIFIRLYEMWGGGWLVSCVASTPALLYLANT
jgi:hypothetical protein